MQWHGILNKLANIGDEMARQLKNNWQHFEFCLRRDGAMNPYIFARSCNFCNGFFKPRGLVLKLTLRAQSPRDGRKWNYITLSEITYLYFFRDSPGHTIEKDPLGDPSNLDKLCSAKSFTIGGDSFFCFLNVQKYTFEQCCRSGLFGHPDPDPLSTKRPHVIFSL